jgi:hypothetical protein
MMYAVSDAKSDNGRSTGARNQDGVLANLPRTRPQRASARRTAARARAGTPPSTAPGRGASETSPPADNGRSPSPAEVIARPAAPSAGAREPTPAKGPASKRRATSAKRPAGPARKASASSSRASAAKAGSAPRQGFDCEGDSASGSVQPPGGIELVASVAEIVGEVAKAGLSTGERLLKDIVSWLPLR